MCVVRGGEHTSASDGSQEKFNLSVRLFFLGTIVTRDGWLAAFCKPDATSSATRVIAEQAYIPSERIRRGRIESDEFDRIVEVSQELQNLPLFIDQTGGITVAQLAARSALQQLHPERAAI